MHKPSKTQIREKKIADLLALVNGELTPAAVRGQKQLISIDWGEESDGNDDWNIFLIDGKRVNRSTFYK
jgi:hypothetical protein